MSNGINQIANGVKIVGETMLPGASLLMDGKVKEGAAHAVVGLGARLLLGPIGWGLVAANSFTRSVANQGVLQVAGGMVDDARNAVTRDAHVVQDAAVEIVEPQAPAEAEVEVEVETPAPAAKPATRSKPAAGAAKP